MQGRGRQSREGERSRVSLIDAHVHLQEEVLAGRVPAIIHRARQAAVGCLVCNGTHAGDWEQVLRLAQTYPEVVPCFGLHPWFVTERQPDWLQVLEGYLDTVPAGIGEVGLDRRRRDGDEVAQEAVFRAQLDLAQRRKLPLVVHCLRAWGWLLRVLDEVGPLPGGMLLHAYSGAAEMIAPLVARGAYFSFAGNVLSERQRRGRLAVVAVPPDRLLVETDTPAMLPPEGFRPYGIPIDTGGVWNEPANLPAIVAGIAALRAMSVPELTQLTRENAQRLFGDIGCRPSASCG